MRSRLLCLSILGLLVIPFVASATDEALELLPHKKDWREVQTANFTILGDAPTRRLEDAAERMEHLLEILKRIATRPVESPIPTFVYVFDSREGYRQFDTLYEGKPREAGGYFMSRDHANFIAISSEDFDRSREVVQHELVHFFTRYNMPGLPVWLNEGLAELYSNFSVAGKYASIGKINEDHLRWLSQNDLIPLPELFSVGLGSAVYNETDRRGVFYAQSWLLVHYLVLGTDDGTRQLFEYLDLSKRMPVEEAIEKAFDRSPKKLLKELSGYLHSTRFTYRRAELDNREGIAMSEVRELPVSEVRARLGELSALLQDRPEQSLAYLHSALEANPQETRAHVGLGMMDLYPAEGEPKLHEALEHFAMAKSTARDDILVDYLVASTRAWRGDPPNLVRPALAKLVRERPQWDRIWELLAWAWQYESEDLQQKIAVFTGALQMHPDKTEYAQTLYDLFLETEQKDKADALMANYFQPRGILLESRISTSYGASPGRPSAAVLDEPTAEFLEHREKIAEKRAKAEERIAANDYEAALVLYAELMVLDPEEPWFRTRYDELEQGVVRIRFKDGYNRAVKSFNEYRWRDTVEELEALLELGRGSEHVTEDQVVKAEKLLEQARTERKKRGDSGL